MEKDITNLLHYRWKRFIRQKIFVNTCKYFKTPENLENVKKLNKKKIKFIFYKVYLKINIVLHIYNQIIVNFNFLILDGDVLIHAGYSPTGLAVGDSLVSVDIVGIVRARHLCLLLTRPRNISAANVPREQAPCRPPL